MIVGLLALLLVQQVTGPAVPPVPMARSSPQLESVSTTNYALSPPRLRAKGSAERVEGTICRRANRSLISPSRVQIDHLTASGDVIDTQFVYVPRLSQREDQRCGRYGTVIKPPLGAGDVIRICLPRSGAKCASTK